MVNASTYRAETLRWRPGRFEEPPPIRSKGVDRGVLTRSLLVAGCCLALAGSTAPLPGQAAGAAAFDVAVESEGAADDVTADSQTPDASRLASMTLFAGSARNEPSVVLENALWRALADFAEQRDGAVEGLSDLQQQVVDSVTGSAVNAETYYSLPMRKTAVADGPPTHVLPGRNCLGKLHDQTFEELTKDPEVLLPLAFFYLDVYSRQNTAEDRFWLASLTYGIVRSLAERYAVEAEDTRSNTIALKLAMADRLQSRRQLRAGKQALILYQEVLELDKRHPLALYGAAYLAERYGSYYDATGLLERLVEVDPTDAEARLRWGVNLLRTQRRQRGEAVLLEVAQGTGDDWMRIVAYEELGRLHGRHPRQALSTIRRGLDEFPDAASLRLMLAFHLRDAWQDAKLELEQVEGSWRRGTELSPRGIYDGGRRLDFTPVWTTLNQQVDARRPALVGALFRLALNWRVYGREEIVQCRAARLATAGTTGGGR